MLRGVDSRVWDELARRRVLHFGYAFEYVTRNVDLARPLVALPPFLQVRLLPCHQPLFWPRTIHARTGNRHQPAATGAKATE
mmetsp:Transcript_26101/g.67153  ORF Transcript_26101/g.67153 Transcript_26101/m.67153 type:complete len:82 (-) Transcript_26101:482-727(-)